MTILPRPPEELEQLYARLAAQYPQAHIEAGTLDEFAEEIRQVRDSLPVPGSRNRRYLDSRRRQRS